MFVVLCHPPIQIMIIIKTRPRCDCGCRQETKRFPRITALHVIKFTSVIVLIRAISLFSSLSLSLCHSSIEL